MDSSRTYEVKWSDLDPNGHVRHSVYDDYAVDARFRWMEEIGFPPTRCSEMGIAPVVLRQESRFYREVTIGETITVTMSLAGLSSDASRWKVHHDIIKSNGERAAVLKVEGTWLDWRTRQAAAPPSELLRLFEQLEQTSNFEELRSLVRRV
jgi:acyl-CoA thioester hydrolase